MIITTSSLVSYCAKGALLSSNQANLTTADFLYFANMSMQVLIAEVIQNCEEYLIYQEPIAVSAGNGTVRVPYRAVNGAIRHLWWEDGTGSRSRLGGGDIEDIEGYSTTAAGTPRAFYLMGNNVILLPTPSAAGNVVCAYPFQPNLLVDSTTTQTITVVGSNSVTVNNASIFTSGAAFDIIDHRSGSGIVYYDLIGTIAGNIITFAGLIPNAAVGNYIALAQQSPVPMIPEGGHPLLQETVILRIETLRGAKERIANAAALVKDARKAWDSLLNNRVTSRPHAAGGGGAQRPVRPV